MVMVVVVLLVKMVAFGEGEFLVMAMHGFWW